MQAPKTQGHILIASDFEGSIQELKERLHPFRCVVFMEENFKIEHAKAVTAEAYVSESQTKYIILAAKEFTSVAQNSLLKLLEEPPTNIEFIIISPTKSNLLATVRSRLPLVMKESHHETLAVELSLSRIDYAKVFAFLKEHARVGKNEAKLLLESLFYKATQEEQLILSKQQLELFDRAYRLLELNSRPQSVLAMVIMSFAGE